MRSVVGVFESPLDAQRALAFLRSSKAPGEEIRLLTPEMAGMNIEDSVPEDDAEMQGIGRAIGGVIGGAIGLAGASHLGSYLYDRFNSFGLASLLIGLGIIAVGILGAWIGVKIMGRFEEASSMGIPHDDLYLYKDALEKDHTVVMVLAQSDERAEEVRRLMAETGAESLDAAQERWWVGLRSAEEEHYVEPKDHKRRVA
jgi:hypothetical protein